MRLPAMLCSDLHLTSNPRDEYRWQWLKDLAKECASEQVKTLLILGDLTDAKDYHPAELTNKLVKSLVVFTWMDIDVIVLQGNHDYLRAGHSYFEFLNEFPRIKFIVSPQELTDDGTGPSVFCLPHSKNPAKDWAGMDFSHYDYLLMHQTVQGAIASNGQAMDGEELPKLNAGKVYSGDIHVPQVIGQVEYVGSPYHVHFGDRFKPRCVLLDRRNRPVDVFFDTTSRVTLKLRSAKELHNVDWLKPGDQVKVVVTLDEAEKHEWRRVKDDITKQLARLKVDLCEMKLAVERSGGLRGRVVGDLAHSSRLSDPDAILAYVEREGLGGDALHTALELLK